MNNIIELVHHKKGNFPIPDDILVAYLIYRKAMHMRQTDWSYEAEAAEAMYAQPLVRFREKNERAAKLSWSEYIKALDKTATKFLNSIAL